MQSRRVPAVLVHGWRSRPAIWDRLVPRLRSESIPYWTFDHSGLYNTPLADLAVALKDFIKGKQEENGYSGEIDFVCHSMGTCLVRYLVEVMDGNRRDIPVRQMVGLGPPNNGSAMAELFCDPLHGREVIHALAGIFVPRCYDPSRDVIVQEFRPGSLVMQRLRNAGTRADVSYRVIIAANTGANPRFFPAFAGKTWEQTDDGDWRMTYEGDGIVPHCDSFLRGAGLDILPADPAVFSRSPDQYCHLHLPRNGEVITRIMQYLREPATCPQSFCP